jgi:hypothetical protein
VNIIDVMTYSAMLGDVCLLLKRDERERNCLSSFLDLGNGSVIERQGFKLSQ